MTTLNDHILHSAAGKFGEKTDTKVADVARILGLALDANPERGLTLHFHGGLIAKKSGLEIAEKLKGRYTDARTFPVFFIWESGVREALLNNKDDIVRDPAFRALVKKASEWVLKKAGSSIVFKGGPGQSVDVDKLRREYDEWFDQQRPSPPLPDNAVSEGTVKTRGADQTTIEELTPEIEDSFDTDPDFVKAMEEAYNAQIPPGQVATRGAGSGEKADVMLLSEQARREMFGADAPGVANRGVLSWIAVARFVAKIVVAVFKRYKAERDHGAYCTIVEEVLRVAYADLIGSVLWNQMKKDTQDSFQTGEGFCGTTVVEALKKLEAAGKSFPQITLVGHSTGAIYICHFLDAAKAAGLTTPIKVVFLAPALTFALFANAISNHQGTNRLQSFRMFAMNDERECADKMFGVIYTRSLLYFVSGLLEGDTVDGKWKSEIDMPIGGMQRYLTQAIFSGADFPQVKTVADFLKADPTRTVWSKSDRGPGLNSDSTTHGGFDDDETTMTSVREFIEAA